MIRRGMRDSRMMLEGGRLVVGTMAARKLVAGKLVERRLVGQRLGEQPMGPRQLAIEGGERVVSRLGSTRHVPGSGQQARTRRTCLGTLGARIQSGTRRRSSRCRLSREGSKLFVSPPRTPCRSVHRERTQLCFRLGRGELGSRLVGSRRRVERRFGPTLVEPGVDRLVARSLEQRSEQQVKRNQGGKQQGGLGYRSQQRGIHQRRVVQARRGQGDCSFKI